MNPAHEHLGGLSSDKRWLSDCWSPDVFWRIGVQEVLLDERSAYQHVQVVQTQKLGRMLILDGNVQCAEADEASYHEMIVHPALCRRGAAHGHGQRALVIGGGDGGAAREILRHPSIGYVDLVDIDPLVTDTAATYLPSIWRAPSGGPLENDPRFHLHHEDGVAFLEQNGAGYDLIVVDASDCIGPGTTLYSENFYQLIRHRLLPRGAVTVQAGSFFYLPDVLATVYRGLAAVFPKVAAYQCFTAVYPGGLWNLAMATLGDAPEHVDAERADALQDLRWYNASAHLAAFVLPTMAQEIIRERRAQNPAELAQTLSALSPNVEGA